MGMYKFYVELRRVAGCSAAVFAANALISQEEGFVGYPPLRRH